MIYWWVSIAASSDSVWRYSRTVQRSHSHFQDGRERYYRRDYSTLSLRMVSLRRQTICSSVITLTEAHIQSRPCSSSWLSRYRNLIYSNPTVISQLKYPLHFFLLRGNHETTIVNRIYGFHQVFEMELTSDAMESFSEYHATIRKWTRLQCILSEGNRWTRSTVIFAIDRKCSPLCPYLLWSVNVLCACTEDCRRCVHRLPYPSHNQSIIEDLLETTNLYQTLNDIRRPLGVSKRRSITDDANWDATVTQLTSLKDPPNNSMPLDLLWSDPYASVKGFHYSIRGVSCTFG